MVDIELHHTLTDLVVRYASAVDRKLFDELRRLFTDDATLVTPFGEHHGIESVIGAMAGLRRYTSTFHKMGQSQFTRDGRDVVGESYCTAHHFTHQRDTVVDRVMYIRYHDRLVPTDDGWRIARRELEVVMQIEEHRA